MNTVIIGGSQAGLSVGYHLSRRGRPFVILDDNGRIGDSWRKRWDSLRLFNPARCDGQSGWPFPAPAWSFPTKDEMSDYLEAYAANFDLPVRTGVSVDGLFREGDRFVVASSDSRFEADHVVVASGACQTPRVPAFASELDSGIVQLHSSEYRNPSQLREGSVLVVGTGNSGAEISFELSRSHRTSLSGRYPGHIPVRHGSIPFRLFLPVVRFVGSRVLTVKTPILLIRVKPKDITAAGIERVARTVGVREGYPVLDDGCLLEVSNEPGLYFVGLRFLYAATSDVLPGVGRDAEYIAEHIAWRESDGRSMRREIARRPEERGLESADADVRERLLARTPNTEPRGGYPMLSTTKARFRAAIVAIVPAVLLAAFVYHPYIAKLTDKAAVAAALASDTTRWGFSHLAVGVGSGLAVLAFLAIRSFLREAGEERWSILALPFIVIGSTLFTFLPAMEIAMLAAAKEGADIEAVQTALGSWFFPILLTGAITFALGVLGFAMGIVRSGVLGPRLTWLVVGALVVMAAARFVPLGAALYVGGAAAIVAMWPLAYEMWKHPEAVRPAGRPQPMPAT